LNGSNYAQKNQIISVITGQQYTYSVWMRSLSGTKNIIFCYDNTNNISATVTTEWQRFTATFTGNTQVYCRFVLESGTSTSVDLLIYGAQLNIGSTAKPYFPTTDRVNVPRLTYQNGGGGCPSLLLEKQSTNLAFPSEDLTAWTAGGMTNTANITTSPDGTQNADKSTIGSTTRYYDIVTNLITTVNGTIYTTSFFAKKGTGIEAIYFYQGNGGRIAKWNLNNGVYIGYAPADGYNAFTSYGSENLGNGWYRFYATYTASSTSGNLTIGVSTNTNDSVTPILGNGTDFVYVWGLQYEASSYPTSYIPTTSASATRVADACSKTGISSLIGQGEGTMFVEVDLTHTNGSGTNQYLMQLYQDAGNRVIVFRTSANELNYYFLNASVAFFSTTSLTTNGRHKLAFAYKSGSSAFYVDGVQIDTNATTFSAFSSLSELQIGANFNPTQAEIGDYNYNQAVIFKTRLTNSELASLTTL